MNVYYERFYIEHGFKDLKGRFNLHRAMIGSTRILERLIALSSPSSGRVVSSKEDASKHSSTPSNFMSEDDPSIFTFMLEIL